MVRKNKDDEIEKEVKKDVANLSNVAYSIVYVDNVYNLVKVAYDPVSKEAGDTELIPCSGFAHAVERFKIETGHLFRPTGA